MGVSEVVDEFERGVLEANESLTSLFESSASAGELRMRELPSRIAFPYWPSATSASARNAAAQEAEIFAILDEYAAAARSLIRAADAERWQALVREAQRRGGEGMLADELGLSTVGASLLRDRLGGRPHRRPQRGGVDCACGYAVDGVLPSQVCPECTELLLRRWVAEERRLLRSMPEYAEEVARVVDDTAQKQAAVFRTRGEFLSSEAFGRRKAAGRALGRLSRRHRAELAQRDLRRWTDFIQPLSRAAETSVRETTAKVHKRGLGAAAITELGILSDREGNRTAAQNVEGRRSRRGAI